MKKLNILVGNNTLDITAGSETATLTLAAEFIRLGHSVTGYSPQLGFIALEMEKLGISCISELKTDKPNLKFELGLKEDLDLKPDVIICSHYGISKSLRAAFPTTPMIVTVHGILHKNPETNEIWPEHPYLDGKVDQFIATSPEVQGLLLGVYNLDAEVIFNAFNLEKFKWEPILPRGEDLKYDKPKMFLINTNYAGAESEEVKIIKDVATHYGAQVKAVGGNFAPSWNIEDVIKDCDVVVGMGRSLLEGFCMGKIALCNGRWGTGGVVTAESYKAISETNFSGRNSQGKLATPDEIVQMIDAALNPDQLVWQLKTVAENHDVRVAAQKYLTIAEKLSV